MIALSEVTFARGGKLLVEDVTLRFERATVTAIVGPNGAGKSTLLRLASGELAPTSGEVTFADRALGAHDARDLARVRGVLGQQTEVAFAFDALDVVLLGRTPHNGGHETEADVAIARRAMLRTGTLELERRTHRTLSGGEQQRVHAARVLAQLGEARGDRALLLDEPTSSLDLVHQHALLHLARRMADEGCAVVVVLHDLNLAARFAHRVVVLDHGRVAAQGAPSDVLTPVLVRDVFGVDAFVVPHPELACPLLVVRGPAGTGPFQEHLP